MRVCACACVCAQVRVYLMFSEIAVYVLQDYPTLVQFFDQHSVSQVGFGVVSNQTT